MIPFNRRTSLACTTLLVAVSLAGTARAQQAERMLRLDGNTGPCAAYGPDFVALGEGICGRVSEQETAVDDRTLDERTIDGRLVAAQADGGPIVDGRMRVDPGSRTLSSGAWPTSGTSDATLRSAGAMLPGISNARHLRIDNDPYGR